MNIRYEKMCRISNCSEDTTNELRKYFGAQHQKLKRRKRAKEKAGIVEVSISAMVNEDGDPIPIEDYSANFEDEFFHQIELEEIRKILNDLVESDRNFLLALFGDNSKTERRLAEEMHVTRHQIRKRKEHLLNHFREILTDNSEGD